MMRISRVSYDALAVEGLQDILQKVSSTCKELGIDFFIIGAIARNIWFASNDEDVRGTKDIDFAVCIPTEKAYNELRKKLIEDYGFIPSTTNAFCLITTNEKQIDLLPFGEIENEEKVIVKGTGLTSLNLVGFKESYQFGLNEVVIGKESYFTSTIPAIVMLKLIAFDDRPDQRIKDIYDINAICKYFPDIETENIWSNHHDLYGEEKSHFDVGMIVLGREIGYIINNNALLKTRILMILNNAINEKSSLLKHMIEDSEIETLDNKRQILENIKFGIENS